MRDTLDVDGAPAMPAWHNTGAQVVSDVRCVAAHWRTILREGSYPRERGTQPRTLAREALWARRVKYALPRGEHRLDEPNRKVNVSGVLTPR
jgi:hypothetical protein